MSAPSPQSTEDTYDFDLLEHERREALGEIRAVRSSLANMAQRPRGTDDPLDNTLLENTDQRLLYIQKQIEEAESNNDLEDAKNEARKQGQLRAYLCPIGEIVVEGTLAMDAMEDWNIPRTAIDKLRNLLGPKLEKADVDPNIARGALRALFGEKDTWADYTDEYEGKMKSFAHWLLVATITLPLLAVLFFHWPKTLLVGLLCAGAAGSCASVMAKMPILEVTPSGELEVYYRRILTRIGVGVIASLIGCAFLAWGIVPISIQNQSFSNVVDKCTVSSDASCVGLNSLILLGIPMLFGFSERALTSFEEKVFGGSKTPRTRP